MGVSEPQPLSETHELREFDCGVKSLNDWLSKHVIKNQKSHASRTFVICEGQSVIGYYSLASGSVQKNDAPKSLQRNMPEPLPVIILGRLAVSNSYQGKTLGTSLLKDAIVRSVFVASNIAACAIMVHAISDAAKNFYEFHGFQASPLNSMTLFLAMKKLKPLF